MSRVTELSLDCQIYNLL